MSQPGPPAGGAGVAWRWFDRRWWWWAAPAANAAPPVPVAVLVRACLAEKAGRHFAPHENEFKVLLLPQEATTVAKGVVHRLAAKQAKFLQWTERVALAVGRGNEPPQKRNQMALAKHIR